MLFAPTIRDSSAKLHEVAKHGPHSARVRDYALEVAREADGSRVTSAGVAGTCDLECEFPTAIDSVASWMCANLPAFESAQREVELHAD